MRKKLLGLLVFVVTVFASCMLVIVGIVLATQLENFTIFFWFLLGAVGLVFIMVIVYFVILSLFEISESLQDISKTLKIANNLVISPIVHAVQQKTHVE